MLIDCKCGATNKLPPATKTGVAARARCGKCKHVFEISELIKARPEPLPPPPPDPMASLFGDDDTDFDATGLDLDTATDEDLIDILLNGRGRCKDGWSPFDNGLAAQLAPVRKELVEKIIPELRRKCFPKIQHADRGAAETQLHDVLVNRMAKDVRRIHTYLCPECGMWHVGHSTERRV
jgi:hypothetical protein